MTRRVLLYFLKNTKASIKRCVIFAALFFLIISSLLISNLSDSFRNEFEFNFDILLTISYSDAVSLEFSEELKNREGVLYSDIEYNWDPSYICFIEMDEDLFIPYYTIPEISFIKTDYYEENRIYNRCETIKGVSESDFLYLKYHDSYKISEGRKFADYELEEGDPVCIVTDGMLTFEDHVFGYIKPGDYIPVTTVYRNENLEPISYKTVWIKVIGLLNDEQEYIPSVFVSARYLEKLRDESDSFLLECDPDFFEDESLYLYNDDFYIESQVIQFDTIDSLEKMVNYLDSTFEYYEGRFTYASTISKYSTILSNVYAVSESFKTISFICILVAVLLSCVLACLESIYRQKEFMILKSLGESNFRILLQFALETLVSLTIAAFISVFLSYSAVSFYISRYINSYNLGNNLSNNPLYSGGYDVYQYATKPTAVHLSCSLSMMHILIIALVVFIIDFLSVLFMKTFIDRYSVREVLGSE